MVPRMEYIPSKDLINLTGNSAIVTGGAAGIGLAISRRLAEAGATVIIVDKNLQGAKEAAQELTGYGYQAIPVQCDVSIEEEVGQMVAKVEEETGSIDVLVNNAGIYPRIPLAEVTSDNFDQVLAVNLKGTFLCCREVSQKMIEHRKGGCIINIVSIDSVHPSSRGLAAYDASKGGVLTLTKSLALELGQHDIRVNAVAPGAIITEGVLSRLGESSTKQDRSELKALMSRIALGRMGRPDDVSRVVLFLASDLSAYMTGSLVVADGGYLIS